MNKKVLLAGFFLGVVGLTIGTLAFSTYSEPQFVEGSQVLYTLTLDTSHRIINNDTIKTDLGNDIPVDCYDVTTDNENYVIVVKNTNHQDQHHVRNRDPINGLTKVKYILGSNSESIRIYYSYSYHNNYDSFGENDYICSSGIEGELDFNLPGGNPSYFSITADGYDTVHIEKLVFYYTCQATPSPVVPESEFGHWTYETVSDHKRLTGFSINQEDIPANKTLVVPNTIGGQQVDEISDGILANVDWVEHLVIPFVGGFRYNSPGATFGILFSASSKPNCQPVNDYGNTHTYYIPNSLKKITLNYGNVDNQQRVHLPNYSFYRMSQIEEITLNARLEIIGENVFSSCDNLEEIYLPESVTSIGAGTFTGCSKLTIRCYGNVSVSESANPGFRPVSENYIETFNDSTLVYDICGNGLNIMSLVNKQDTVDLTIPDSVTYRGDTLTVTSIANRAFEGAESLKHVYISQHIQKVGHYAFKGAYKANIYLVVSYYSEEIYMSNWDYDIGAYYENYVAGPFAIDNVNYCQIDCSEPLPRYVTEYVVDTINDYSSSVTFNEATRFYGAYCCEGNENLVSITIPHYVIYGGIGPYAFYNCSNLENVTFQGTRAEWESITKGANYFCNTKVTKIICSADQDPDVPFTAPTI